MILKKLTLFLIVIINVSFITVSNKNTTEIKIKPSSKLTIKGITNITDFSCKFNSVALKKKTPITYIKKENHTVFENAKLVLENKEFDCGKRIINNDFRDLLKTETYPKITILLKEVKHLNTTNKNTIASVDFLIAGVTKSYDIPITITHDHSVIVDGDIKLNIRDFGLENPKKILGLIKIEDEVTVHFKLDLEVL
ncbi:YceI family protein [uncultured Formosa sp.]|uniref:YceI family protein n=1 Tax=uncultured Formosa sp. TaxID=255435 RepID=UPI002634CBC3|nr:YceI family protein [uncultured Formosa sp.]